MRQPTSRRYLVVGSSSSPQSAATHVRCYLLASSMDRLSSLGQWLMDVLEWANGHGWTHVLNTVQSMQCSVQDASRTCVLIADGVMVASRSRQAGDRHPVPVPLQHWLLGADARAGVPLIGWLPLDSDSTQLRNRHRHARPPRLRLLPQL